MRLLALVVLICLMLSGASASTGLDELMDGKQPLALDLSAQLEGLSDAPEALVQRLQGWLNRLRLQLSLDEAGWQTALYLDEAEILRLSQWEAQGQQALSLSPADLHYRGMSPLERLLGMKPPQGADSLISAWQQTLSELAPLGSTKRQSSAIKNVGTAVTRQLYAIDQALWQQFWPPLAQALGELTGQTMPDIALTAPASLARLQDKAGQDIGLLFKGELSLDGGAPRKATMLAGYAADTGGYIDLKLPAVKGRDDLSFRLSARQTQGKRGRELKADWVYSWRLADDRASGRGELSLLSALDQGSETITGRLRLDHRPEAGPDIRLSLEPQLALTNSELTGSLKLTQSRGGKPWLTLILLPRLRAADRPQWPEMAALDLDALDQAALSLQSGRLMTALAAPLAKLSHDLPEDDYWQLMHYLGRGLWTQNRPVAPLTDTHSIADDFVVHDIIEEENP